MAVDSGSLAMVWLCLEKGADINPSVHSKGGFTPLQLAYKHGNPAIVNLLLKYDADVNDPAAGERGRTALEAAAGRAVSTLSTAC